MFLRTQRRETMNLEQQKQQLAAEYVDMIGYDPFEDDPAITVDEVRDTLREYHDARSGGV